jgi:hypothetical protein
MLRFSPAPFAAFAIPLLGHEKLHGVLVVIFGYFRPFINLLKTIDDQDLVVPTNLQTD